MLATRATTAFTSSMASGLPQAVEAFVGSALALAIHSIETLRDRLGHFALRASSPLGDRER